jgi:hypothetical protein
MIRKTSVTTAISALALSFAAPTLAIDLAVQGSGRGGPFRVMCPGGSYVVGFEGRTGAWIDNFRIVCAAFDASSRRFVNPRTTGGTIGVSGSGGPSSARCPNGWAIARIKYQETKGDGPTNVGHSIGFTCGTAFSGELTNKHFGPLTTPEERSSGGIFVGRFGADIVETPCPAFEFATGVHGRSGKFVDALGLICGPLPAAPAPAPVVTTPPPPQQQPAQPQQPQPTMPQPTQAPTPAVARPGQEFTGTWVTTSERGAAFELTLIQQGREVVGSYVTQNGDRGRIKGRVGAGVMQFEFVQDSGFRGNGQFNLAPDGNSFTGGYRAAPHPSIPEVMRQGQWNATRK